MVNADWNLKKAPVALRCLVAWFVFLLLIAYGVALLKVYDQTHFDSQRIVDFYRGDAEGLLLPPSFSTLLAVSHVHLFSQPVAFFLLGILFYFTSISGKFKAIFINALFFACLLSNIAPWCLRYGSAKFLFLLPFSQAILGTSFFVMSAAIFRDLVTGQRVSSTPCGTPR